MMEYTVELKEIIDETNDVKTFRFDKPEGFDFISGQFCMVEFVDKPDLPSGKKPFTFSSSPTESYVDMTIKEVGEFTKAIFTLQVGDKLKFDGPRGKSLNFDESIEGDVVFVAGGSGITPFMSALRYIDKKDFKGNYFLLFGNREQEDIIYCKELDILNQKENIHIRYYLTCENPTIACERGRIDREKILHEIKEPKNKVWYVCGPPPMNHAIKEVLDEIGIPEEKIMIDKWEIPGKNG